jgi:hypothetical protein
MVMGREHLSSSASRRIRKEKKEQQIGPNARCRRCGARDVEALLRDGLCYECAAELSGRSTKEVHHVLGRDYPDAIRVPANIHRILSDRQLDWGQELSRGDPADPLRWLARLLCFLRDVCALAAEMLDRALRWVLVLWQTLRERYGDRWWRTFGLDAGVP